MQIRIYIYIFLLLLIASCSDEKAGKADLPDSSFVYFYADSLILAEEANFAKTADTLKRKKMEALYEKYGLTPEKTASTLEYLKSDIERWRTFNLGVVKRLESLQEKKEPVRKKE